MNNIKNFQSGSLVDNRPVEKKLKDFKFEEIVSSADAVNWRDKDPDDWKRYPIFDQDGSGSCVAQTLAKLMGIMYAEKNGGEYVHFSATHIYQRRSNRPSGGMLGINAFDIGREGVTLEALVPSQKMNDQEMDSAQVHDHERQVGEIFKLGNYVTLPILNIETIASTIQKTGKPVMVWLYFTSKEWVANKKQDYTVPELMDNLSNPSNSAAIRHSITAVEAGLHNGKKALICEDSAHFGGVARRVLTEDFFNSRNFFNGYALNFKFEEGPVVDDPKPKHYFEKDLYFSPIVTYDIEVTALQDILKYEGLFPKNVESTGYYGAITAKAVYEFQVKYGVASQQELETLQGRVVGPKTRRKLNQLYS